MKAAATNARPRVSLEEFKRFARETAPAARAVLMARAFAEVERARVDAYILPLFATFRFEYRGDLAARCGCSGPILSPRELYLCDDEAQVQAYFAACDAAHRAHGFTGPDGHCPALRAEQLRREAERALIELAAPLFGISADAVGYGDDRKEFLHLIIGACMKAEGGAR